jgi:molybdate transport system ATP-binding protein
VSVLEIDVRGTVGTPLEVAMRAEPGITVVFGPSGAGKTTLLNAILGAVRPRGGRIVLGDRVLFDAARGTDLPVRARRVGIVFQDARPFPHLNARANVAFGIRGPDRARRADEWLDRVGAGSLKTRRAEELSGGERQRIALARALAAEPEALLLDEPLSGLELASREQIGSLLLELRRRSRIPFLHVTHDPREAVRLGDRLVCLDRGRVVAEGAPPELLSPAGAAAFAAGSTNWLRAVVLESGAEEARVDLGGTFVVTGPLHCPAGTVVDLALPAEEPILAAGEVRGVSARNSLPGIVSSLQERDGVVAVVVATPVPLRVHVTTESARELGLAPGARVVVLIKATAFRP